MKCEILYRISSLLIALILTAGVASLAYVNQNTHKTIIDIANKIDGLKSKIDTSSLKIDNINVNKKLLDKIDELTRLNTWLEMENAAQRHEISEFGWLKEASKNIK